MILERPWNLKFLFTPKTLDCEDNRPGTSEVGWGVFFSFFFFLFLNYVDIIFFAADTSQKLKIWRKSIERNENIFVSFRLWCSQNAP